VTCMSLIRRVLVLFSFFSSLCFCTIILSFLLFLSLRASVPTLLAPALPKIPFCVSEGAYLSTRSISLFFVTH
jgi:hypothetical protein